METEPESAAWKVLNTTELLEQVLLQLPLRDLLLAQGVSSRWRATITESPRIQTALCYRTDKLPVYGPHFVIGSPDRDLAARFHQIYKKERQAATPQVQATGQWMLHGIKCGRRTINPVMKYLFKDPSTAPRSLTSPAILSSNSDSSWRKMYIAQPPPTQVIIHRIPDRLKDKDDAYLEYTYVPPRSSSGWRTPILPKGDTIIENADGVTISNVVERMETEFLKDGGEGFYFCSLSARRKRLEGVKVKD